MRAHKFLPTLFLLMAAAAYLGPIPRVHAEVASTTLQKLTAQADAIAVARVTSVELIGGVRVASASVIRSLKGLHANQRFAFLAQGTWTCDASYAVSGETVLIFLVNSSTPGFNSEFLSWRPWFGFLRRRHLPGVPFYFIAHSGAGRMPVLWKNGQAHLNARNRHNWEAAVKTSLKTDTAPSVGGVKLPTGIGGISGVRDEWGLTYLVPLREVEAAVRRSVRTARPVTLAKLILR
jgi:hypothetical protein